ncbi:MAG: hypothetical protein HY791_29215 [Deltaproteobacteria bacterium]|nr:hypothetical protein [Deltaproteobacteria bacterium]
MRARTELDRLGRKTFRLLQGGFISLTLCGFGSLALLTSCDESRKVTLGLFPLEEGESGYLIGTESNGALEVRSVSPEPTEVTLDAEASSIHGAALLDGYAPPLGWVSPGSAGTDRTVAEVAPRRFSASFDGTTFGRWEPGGVELGAFVLPIPRGVCEILEESPAVTHLDFVGGLRIGVVIDDESIVVGSATLVRLFTDGRHLDLSPPFPSTASSRVLRRGRIILATPRGVGFARWDGAELAFERGPEWAGLPAGDAVGWIDEAPSGSIYAMTFGGRLFRADDRGTELVLDLEAPVPAYRGAMVLRRDGTLMIGIGADPAIITLRDDEVTMDPVGIGSGVTAMAEGPDGRLLAADGFGGVFQLSGRLWEPVGKSPFAVPINDMEAFDEKVLLGSDRGFLGELAADEYCTPSHPFTKNVRILRRAPDGVFALGQSVEGELVDFAFMRRRGR